MRDVVEMQVRVPADVWEWLTKQSAANVRSKNGEIIFTLRQKMREQVR